MLRCLWLLFVVAAAGLSFEDLRSPSSFSARQSGKPVLPGAELVYRLTQFVLWPDPAPGGFTVCVTGDDPEIDRLSHLLKGRIIEGQPAVIRRIAPAPDQVASCRVLFIGRSLQIVAHRITADLGQYPVLTVAAFPGFASRGGMVQLPSGSQANLLVVNVEVARRAGLTLNSGILSIASIDLATR
jgi:hypothetical protein